MAGNIEEESRAEAQKMSTTSSLFSVSQCRHCPPEMCDALDLTELWSAGSGLVDAEGYKQYTDEWICLDYFTVY
ncbi:hypothetical protein SRHO_G00017900 [Serrasalmus rhombeus]